MNIEKPSFKKICLMHLQALTNFPYIEKDFDAITDYELLCKVVDYLNQVISNNNEQNTVVENLYDAFVELKDYVDNYFDDLDVQEEINNKLNEMAESGQLTDIIAQYLGLAGMITFNTVSEMKNATNLVNGSKCETLGYYSVNDGGNAIYKVRNVTNEDVVDEMFIISLNNNTLIGELIIDENTNVKQLGAKGDDTNDDTTPINSMIEKLGYAYLPNGIYKTTSSIILTSNQSIYGQDKVKTKIHYTGNSNCITNEDISTSNHISIHDLTIQGTNKTGKGIYLIRTTKNGDTWHRLKNLIVNGFDYGIHLYKNLNEIMLDDVTSNSNNYGLYIEDVNDFYLTNIVTAVNTNSGITLLRSTEARLVNVKAWYNGNAGNSYYNLTVNNCVGIMITNLGCQESYFSNLRIAFSKDVSIQNCYLSKPNLDTTQAEHQILFESNKNVSIDCLTANIKVNDSYFNKLIEFKNKSYNCDINIKCEEDYPDSLKETIADSSKGQALEVCNSIKIVNKNIRYNHNMNFALNGDLSNTNTMDMVNSGSDKLSWVNGLLRLNSGETQSGCNFKTSQLPITGCYTWYIKFKKVSGSGRVVLDYTCYADIGADDPVGTEYYASKLFVNNNTDAKANLYVRLPANTVIDIIEIGYTLGESSEINLPLYYKAKI